MQSQKGILEVNKEWEQDYIIHDGDGISRTA